MNTIKKIIAASVVATICVVSISEARTEENQILSDRQKAMIPIAAFTATGNMPKLETALIEGLDAGLTVNEIKEILVHT
ncbi:MAG: 4-carboxymuconolactone decarboxylase, partial [Chloroflexota bacterium]